MQARRDWMGLMPRGPETGTVMVRGRAGATGAPFNLGEVTVTRCTVALADGRVGHAWVQGGDGAKARRAALCDALMQGPEAATVEAAVLAPPARGRGGAAIRRCPRSGPTGSASSCRSPWRGSWRKARSSTPTSRPWR